MRVFIGLEEIASVVFSYAKGFQALGHETYTLVRRRNPFYPEAAYDVVLEEAIGLREEGLSRLEKEWRRFKRRFFLPFRFLYALLMCKVFVFVFASSFFERYRDYPILKFFKKRIVCVFLGDDIRHWIPFEQEARHLGVLEEMAPVIETMKGYGSSLEDQLEKVRAAERSADLILSLPSTGQLQTKPYMRVYVPIDLSLYRFHVPARSKPLILHAPSSRSAKGTDFILTAVEQLRGEGLVFEFRLVEKTPNDELRALLTESDIVVDQLFSNSIATVALEAMATGNVVLARYSPDHVKIPPDCPAVNTSIHTLAENLREVIQNQEKRCRLANRGRPYVEKYHGHKVVARQILEWLEEPDPRDYDFVPTFFRNTFTDSSGGSNGT